MFSIIIPLYNKALYIEIALNSIINQSFKFFEIIIINDGSTDEGEVKVNNYFLTHTSPVCGWRFISQQNQGVSTARNYGVSLAKFEYIAFLDADDWWAPDYLENMKSLINRYPEAGIYASSYYKVKNNRNIPAVIGVEPLFSDGIINYFKVYSKTLWMPIWTGATIIKKKVFNESSGFNPKLKLGEDFDLWARVASCYQVAFLNKHLAYYNQDVDINSRAAGIQIYEMHEYMIFNSFSVKLMCNPDFVYLYERLALPGLIPYYMFNKNWNDVKLILDCIHWKNHEFKYYLYYKILSPSLLKRWLDILKSASKIKQFIIRRFISRSN